jgi:16S rRNA processing protein RimM
VASPELVIVGRLRKAHGIRGDLVVEPITDAPAEVFTAGRRLFAGTIHGDRSPDGRELVVEQARPFKGGFIVRFDAIHDRSEAELWRNRYVLVPANELAPPAEGEVFLHELIGMAVVLGSGDALGEVIDVYELPQGLVLDVRRLHGETVMLPYQDGVVQRVDRAGRRLVVDPPPGMLD